MMMMMMLMDPLMACPVVLHGLTSDYATRGSNNNSSNSRIKISHREGLRLHHAQSREGGISVAAAAAAAAASQTCLRAFSTAPKKQDSGLLSILGESTARNTSSSQQHGSSVATRLAREAGLDRPTQTREMIESERRSQFQRQIYRKWQPGDVYAPHDLSGAEQKKWKYGRKRPTEDAFDVLGINPILEYKNFTIMSEYMTETGRIKHSKDTGLRPKNQRKIAKAIRRAIGLGLMPSVHRHPLVIKKSHPSRFL